MKELTMALRAAKLSQAEAAELLGVHRVSIANKARGAVESTGDLEYLIATWPELDEAARRRVKEKLIAMRKAE
jgi:predicted XRE-type DNA-binding protein